MIELDRDPVCDIQEFLFPYVRDPELAGAFRSKWPELAAMMLTVASPSAEETGEQAVAEARPLPAFPDLTATQFTLFDNQGKRNRWGANIKTWTTRGEELNFNNPAFICNVTFWESQKALKEAEGLFRRDLKYPLSAETVGLVDALISGLPDATHIGLAKFNAHGAGGRYLDCHVIAAEISPLGDLQSVEMFAAEGALTWGEFVTTDANDKPLKNKARMMSRTSDIYSGWANAPLTGRAYGRE